MNFSPDVVLYAANVATVITALAVVLALLSFVGEKQQRHREFENLYVQRYWSLLDSMSDAFRLTSQVTESHDLRVADDYLRLCEDQIDIRRMGLVTHKTWSFWGPSILEAIHSAPYEDLLAAAGSSAFPGLRGFMRSGDDPYLSQRCRLRKIWSRINGL